MTSTLRGPAAYRRGEELWPNVEEAGGVLPPLPPGIDANEMYWEAMGAFKRELFLHSLSDCLPGVSAQQWWPWLARASYRYLQARERSNQTPAVSPRTVASLSREIRSDAEALAGKMVRLATLANLPGGSGSGDYLARGEVHLLNEHFGSSQSAETKKSGLDGLFNQLHKLASAPTSIPSDLPRRKERAVSDPALIELVLQCWGFWSMAAGTPPSAGERRDGSPRPFVRLVDACSRIAGGPGASIEQVRHSLRVIKRAKPTTIDPSPC